MPLAPLKTQPKAEMHIFVGVAEHAKVWKYFNKISRHVQMSGNITFDEKNMCFGTLKGPKMMDSPLAERPDWTSNYLWMPIMQTGLTPYLLAAMWQCLAADQSLGVQRNREW